ncbi:hypothetical protein Poli38472_002839 [Pythium oligandrum]|uniref:Alpha-mannosidase n=1 Tax=Pythium oligandrum TaxID=41045 RepID=A0A8K1C5N2_PYTOL|nr:hypothetical protein Poli38472_002839 [Pythium oligandrum]|eukprot:TMW56914.1 hypothetical protein Poli38472_002839 [Pythium oligandrum]
MRAPLLLRCATAALLSLTLSTSTTAQSPPPTTLIPLNLTKTENCDPSKWKPPVDGKYNTQGKIDPNKLNVHLIPHSHDDPGWIITVDQYYYERVQFILDTSIDELLKNPDRKFMFVEQSFFQRWWNEQDSKMKETVKQLVKEGRLDLSVNGGWVMHDEAAPHYIAMIDQTAYGHQLLKDEFNVTPRIGWQIDPFGHSSTQGSLLSAGVGFDALYFARMDYQDYGKRFANKDLEFIWRPSKSRGKAMQTFTGQMIDHYGSPGHFHYNSDTPVQDDPTMHDYNVCDQVNWFVDTSLMRGAHTKGNHIFIPMGDDFAYQNARKWFKSIDKLIHYVNQDDRVNVLYSNLSYYTDLKLAEDLTWSVKTDDLFPYASQDHEYWSGYFTSRPTLKKISRVANSLLQQLRQLDAVYQSHHSVELDKLQRSLGLVQHHDGISGTEKQRVSDDYALRINEGFIEAEKEFNDVMFVIGEKEKFQFCLQSNVSICELTKNTEKVELFVHNALPRKSVETISVPVSRQVVKVSSLGGGAEPKNVAVYKNLRIRPETGEENLYKVTFSAELEPLSDYRFLIEQFDSPEETDDAKFALKSDVKSEVSLENDFVSVTIDTKTGSIVSLTNKKKQITIPVTLDVGYYLAYQGKNGRHSGAYVFRPDSKTVYSIGKEAGASVSMIDLHANGSSGKSRIAFQIGKWATLEYILNDDDSYLEIEWTVGPIPIDDKKGKEVILRFDTQKTIQSAGTWYSDSNGVEFVTRVRNHRDTWDLQLRDDQEFVAANYVPITTGTYLKDSKHQLNIVTDRAQGVSSLEDGQLEVMVHRRLLMDDQKGVDENLNETETYFDPFTKKHVTSGLTARGSLFLNVDDAQDGMRSIRSRMEKAFFTPLVALRKSVPKSADIDAKVPWLTVSEFPANVGLTTLVEISKTSVMVRLTHLYAVDEHETLSKAVSFDFAKFFTVKQAEITEVTELTLTGTAELSKTRRANNLAWKVEGEDDSPVELPKAVDGTVVELQAMEIRTFRVTFSKKQTVGATVVKSRDNMATALKPIVVDTVATASAIVQPLAMEDVLAIE